MKRFKLLSKSLKRSRLMKNTEGARYDLYHLEGSLCLQNKPATWFFLMSTAFCTPVHMILF